MDAFVIRAAEAIGSEFTEPSSQNGDMSKCLAD